MDMPRAEDWRNRGGYFTWRPTAQDARPAEIFHVELGDPGAPVLLLVHGWPTSSVDWFSVAGQLSARFRVCALDFPGYGFSDKPPGWGYRAPLLVDTSRERLPAAAGLLRAEHPAGPN
ncbi:MAG TPA: alpha/beta fold hydrolase [Streptosporangiaceae bacterium]|nr:alpha/beta fold hydrolase [Streptosporangiaceae bacterium]